MDNLTADGRATISVEEATRVLGVARGSAYEAARRGEIPTLRIGRRLLVPVAALLKLLHEPERANPEREKP